MRALSEIKGFGPKRLEALAKRGILSSLDLIERLPNGYRDTTHPISPAQNIKAGAPSEDPLDLKKNSNARFYRI